MSDAAVWTKQLELYIDLGVGGANPIVSVGTDTSNESTASPMVQGENRPVRIRFGTRAGSAWTPLALEVDDVISLTGKSSASPAGILFFTDDFTLGGTGADPYYDGILSLNGSSLASALTAATLVCRVDVRVVGIDGLKTVAQYEITIRRRVHEDTPVDPDELPNYLTETESDARYMTRGQFLIPAGLQLVVDADGNISVKEITA